ncbi:hypothetical protein N7475_005297 [Penicillium sp. IBT 31633x]|nr:hypothetical protein N7475_005297 [Penicillium sp. IBT 31633x]
MSQTAEDPSRDVSIWEQAYHDAWRDLRASVEEIVTRLSWENPSTEYRQTTIERFDRLEVHLDRIQSTGQAMFEHDTGCETVRQEPLVYFAHSFIQDCLHIRFGLSVLKWKLMNRPQSDWVVHNRLLGLLEHIRNRLLFL